MHFALANEVPLTVANLVKLSKAVDPWGSTLAVDINLDGELCIWGLIDQSLHYSTYIVKEVSVGPEMPGMFQSVITGVGEIAVYATYVLLGSLKQDTIVKAQQRVFQSGPIYKKLSKSIDLFRDNIVSTIGREIYDIRGHWDDSLEDLWLSTLCRLLISIQHYGHGGAILLADNRTGLKSKHSLTYSRLADALSRAAVLNVRKTHYSDEIMSKYIETGADEMPADLYLDESVSDFELAETESEVTGCIRFLSSLSRIDGLIWLDPGLQLRAFGVEITIQRDPPEIKLAQNPSGSKFKTLELNHFGMRHRSMIRYCASNEDSVGFVVSQDGDVRAITAVKNHVVVWENVRIHSIYNSRVQLTRAAKE